MSNLDTLRDLGDGLANLYTAVNGRVGYEDPADLLAELVDEMNRLCNLTRSRVRRSAAGTWLVLDDKQLDTGCVELLVEARACDYAASMSDLIDRCLLASADQTRLCDDYQPIVSWLLPQLLDAACACLCWGVTR